MTREDMLTRARALLRAGKAQIELGMRTNPRRPPLEGILIDLERAIKAVENGEERQGVWGSPLRALSYLTNRLEQVYNLSAA